MVSWTRIVAAALWAAYLVELTTGDGWREISTPLVRWLALGAGVGLGTIAILAARGGIARERPPWPQGWSFAIAAIPLFLLLRAGTPGLDETSAMGRPAFAGGETPLAPDAEGFHRLDGLPAGPVRVRAMVVRAVGRLAYLLPATGPRPPDAVALLRYRITCCAADAVPVAVAVEGLPPGDFEDGQWIECEGEVEARDGGQVLRIGTWKRIARPREPFLYVRGAF